MGRESKWDYFKAIYLRYHRASKAMRQQILNEFCQVCGYHRKYAIRLLNGPPPGKSKPRRRVRSVIYGSPVISILAAIWEAAGYPWSVRLKALLPLWMPWATQRFHLTRNLQQQLLKMSPRTMDLRLQARKRRLKKKIYGRTKPGTLLKHHIPLKTDHWDVTTPGFTEIDLVSHSGNSAEGEFIHSLNQTDIKTTWTETRAVMGKGQTRVMAALKEIEEALPFDLKGIDSDNGSEFINYHLKAYCDHHKIQFTRSRPYKKDDNAHIEQKNWTHVRKIFGYVRYDSQKALSAMNDLYRNELRLFQNLFLPSVKLVRKVRVGSKLKRVYGTPKTPFERVCECPQANPAKVAQLKTLQDTLNPFDLSKTIDQKLEWIYQLANHRRCLIQSSTSSDRANTNKSNSSCRIEKETMKTLSEVFGIPVYVKNRTRHRNA